MPKIDLRFHRKQNNHSYRMSVKCWAEKETGSKGCYAEHAEVCGWPPDHKTQKVYTKKREGVRRSSWRRRNRIVVVLPFENIPRSSALWLFLINATSGVRLLAGVRLRRRRSVKRRRTPNACSADWMLCLTPTSQATSSLIASFGARFLHNRARNAVN